MAGARPPAEDPPPAPTARARRPLHCPTCGRPIEWSEVFPYRPFCSERCRLIDLGAWLSEQRAIPGEGEPVADEAESTPPDDPPTA